MRLAVRRRRGRYLYLVAAGAYIVGCLPLFAFGLLGLVLGGRGGGLLGLLNLLWPVVYVALATGTFYTRLRGISI